MAFVRRLSIVLKIIFLSNPHEIGALRAGDEDFGCRMMDFECMEARCCGAAGLEEWEKNIFLV